MRRLGDLSFHDLLEGVEALAAGVEVVHQMHFGFCGGWVGLVEVVVGDGCLGG